MKKYLIIALILVNILGINKVIAVNSNCETIFNGECTNINNQNNINNNYSNNSPTLCSEKYYWELKSRYEELKLELREMNPYNQLAQNAPIQNLQPIDIEHLKSVQASDRFGAGLLAMQNPNAPRPDYAAMEMRNAMQLEQAARYNQAIANAQKTGLSLEHFLAGRGMDYNSSYELAKREMEQYEELMLQCLKNMRR